MTQKPNSRIRRGLCLTLPGIAVLSVMTVAATRPVASASTGASKAAAAWVSAHKDALPTRLPDLAALPFAHRRAIMASLPLQARKGLIREHLEAFVTPEGSRTALQNVIVSSLTKPLTPSQVAFLRAEIDSLEYIFSDQLTAEERSAKASAVCARARNIFPAADAQLIFVAIGGRDDTYFLAMSDGTPALRISAASMTGGMTALIRAAAGKVCLLPAAMAPCYCHQGERCECPGGYLCVQSWPVCDAVIMVMCGCYQTATCDGGKCA